jgi:1-acyl-sn-glycerol-3-phosphate acyltransferase
MSDPAKEHTMPTPEAPEIRAFTPPPKDEMRALLSLPRFWFAPQFLGLAEIDVTKPALFVGNHTLFGLTDAPLMIEHLYTRYGVMLRGLGDRGHFAVPFWGDFLVKHGMVLGSPENCSALMQAGAHVLVFPGGGREVMRRKGEHYRLIWKSRAGFARLAIEHGYDIVPFGSVGPDESYRILFDAGDVTRTGWLHALAERLGLLRLTRNGDLLPPLAIGVGPTLIPRPQKYYFGFGPRIATEHLRGRQNDEAAVWSVRERVARAVQAQIARLIAHRKEDRPLNWSPPRRWLAPVLA